MIFAYRFMRLTFTLLVISTTLLAQETRFFTPYFQNVTSEKTDNVRKYIIEENKTLIEDFESDTISQRGSIYGLTKIDQVNAFAWYCISLGNAINYREFFYATKGDFEFYDNGNIAKRVIIQGIKVRYAQVWDASGREMLTNGNGENRYDSKDYSENVFERYADSVLVESFGVRSERNDTIHYTCDKQASPKEGLQTFYQNLIRTIKYPGIARLAGKEGRIYIQFIVDRNGNLTDFKPLTKEGFNFEKKTIKKLESFPPWYPAAFNSRNVKSKFILPVKFQLTN
jgi:hypothetical protein